MNILLFVFLLLVACGGVACFTYIYMEHVGSRVEPWRPIHVRIHLKDTSPSVEGVLIAEPGAYYQLQIANAVAESGTISLDGTTYVPRDNVLFWQEVVAT